MTDPTSAVVCIVIITVAFVTLIKATRLVIIIAAALAFVVAAFMLTGNDPVKMITGYFNSFTGGK